jgi:hypothetical protein
MAGTRVIPLTESEAREILSARFDGILVGGQALAIWARYFNVAPPSALESGITLDLDFLGTRADAERSQERLSKTLRVPVDLIKSDMSDATPNSAKILIREYNQRDVPVEIDFLIGLAGFTPSDEQSLRLSAVDIEVGDTIIKVMHPVDCLMSRVYNVHRLPEKRSPTSIAQCHLAIAVVNAYLTDVCRLGSNAQRGEGLKMTERVVKLALSSPGINLAVEFGIDLLAAIPANEFSSNQFREKRWPQIQQAVAEGIEKLKRQRERRRRRVKPA